LGVDIQTATSPRLELNKERRREPWEEIDSSEEEKEIEGIKTAEKRQQECSRQGIIHYFLWLASLQLNS
jgi:hypothetical protein